MCKNCGKLKEGSEGQGEWGEGKEKEVRVWGFLRFGWEEEDELDGFLWFEEEEDDVDLEKNVVWKIS